MDVTEPTESQYSSYLDGKRLDFRITAAQVHATLRWEEDAPDPPLSARDAMRLVQAFLPRLVPEADCWKVQNLTVYPWGARGYWLYTVHCTGFHPPNVHDGPVPHLDIPVLMDGTVIEPIVSDYPPR